MNTKKSAFTMIELVFVIVVLGILAALALPRMERDIRQEAGDNILSAIRFTKHMALTDNVTDPRQNDWQKAFWRFGVRTCLAGDIFYYIGSDNTIRDGDIDNTEAAHDPINGRMMLGSAGVTCASGTNNNASPNIFITKKYGIKDTNIFANCDGAGADEDRYIGFDNLGRPHTGFSGSSSPNYGSIMTTDCNLTFEFEDTSINHLIIRIEKQTGHAYIVE